MTNKNLKLQTGRKSIKLLVRAQIALKLLSGFPKDPKHVREAQKCDNAITRFLSKAPKGKLFFAYSAHTPQQPKKKFVFVTFYISTWPENRKDPWGRRQYRLVDLGTLKIPNDAWLTLKGFLDLQDLDELSDVEIVQTVEK